jgi:hypothetical protein
LGEVEPQLPLRHRRGMVIAFGEPVKLMYVMT